MKKNQLTLLAILLIAVIFVGGFLFLKNNKQAKEVNTPKVVEEESKTKTISYENGDYLYVPDAQDIGYDHETEILYFEKVVNVFLNGQISDEQAEELAQVVDGTIVGRIDGAINVLQLQVEEETFDGLSHLAAKYDKAELVKYAELSTPSFVSGLSGKPEENIDINKNNWWAEAINVYPAWDYIDKNGNDFDPVKVAVLEAGKLDSFFKRIDEDINDSVISKETIKGSSYNEHATVVTKLIAANKEHQKIRGVAGDIVDIKFTSINTGITKEEEEKIEENNQVMTDLQLISIMKSNIEKDVKVFNHSWGFPPMEKAKWDDEKDSKYNQKIFPDFSYQEYKDALENSNDKVSSQLLIALDDLLSHRKLNSEFLIIQSAGNGYSRVNEGDRAYKHGILAKYTGTFANINEVTYDNALKLVGKDSLNNELNEILDHIIVVGGAAYTDDDYRSPDWASYGAAVDLVGPAEKLLIDDEKWHGTSFSAPMVSGAAAMIWYYNDQLTAREVKHILITGSTVDVAGRKDDKRTYPMLNVTESLALASTDFEEWLMNSYSANSEVYDERLCTIAEDGVTTEKTPIHYKNLIKTYQTAIRDAWEPEKLYDMNIGPDQYQPEPLPSNYGYEFRDINNDGILELILGIDMEDTGPLIQEIYTLVEGKPVKFFNGGLRHGVNIYCNETINEYAVTSPGRGISINLFYELDVTDLSKKDLDDTDVRYEIDGNPLKKFKDAYEENATEGTYTRLLEDKRIMSEIEVEALRQKHKKIEPSFKPFVKEKESEKTAKKS